MKIVNRSREEEYINLSQNRDAALKKLETVRDATQGPNTHRVAKFIAGKKIELKQPENEPCDYSEDSKEVSFDNTYTV